MSATPSSDAGRTGLSRLLPGEFGRDFAASFVVFLVAVPLCLGIAIASGVPAELGLMTGIIGGIVVGSISGSPLQVSGPAAGLAVIVFEMVQKHGLAAMGLILMLAGLLQLAAGALRIGQWFRGVSPAVVHGMLAGIGVLIVAGQLHVLIDRSPLSSGLDNLAAIPGAFFNLSPANPGAMESALLVGLLTIAAMIGWDKLKPARLRLLPGALMGVVAGTATAALFGLGVKRIDVPQNILAGVSLPDVSALGSMFSPAILLTAVAVAFIASAETLLSAAAVDRMQTRVQAKYNKELGAQGVGNFLCGMIGALPMTGVIVRSSANVQAGAVSRLSTILHGVWILGFVALLPQVLAIVPTATLAGVLVVTGWKLVKVKDVRALFQRYGALPAAIWALTFVLVVTVDLLTGVIVGLAVSMLEILPHMRKLGLRIDETEEKEDARHVALEGKVTAFQITKLTRLLDQLPSRGQLKLDLKRLVFADHTTSELIVDALKRKRDTGVDVEVETGGNVPGQKIAAQLA